MVVPVLVSFPFSKGFDFILDIKKHGWLIFYQIFLGRTYSSVVIDEPPSTGNYGWALKAALIPAPFHHRGVSFV